VESAASEVSGAIDAEILEEVKCFLESDAKELKSRKNSSSAAATNENSFTNSMKTPNFGVTGISNHSYHTLSSLSENRNIILHLRVSDEAYVQEFTDDKSHRDEVLCYNPEIITPSPYENQHCFLSSPCPVSFDETSNKIKHDDDVTCNSSVDGSCTGNVSEIDDLHGGTCGGSSGGGGCGSDGKLASFLNSENSTRCWWCCHTFNTETFKIPCRKVAKSFKTLGYFCSPECATAYIFESGYKYGDVQKQHYWLNFVYGFIEKSGKYVSFQPAPPRQTLNIFGGPYCIDVFRSKSKNYDIAINHTLAPLVPIRGFTDEIIVEYKKSKKFIPMEKERIERASAELKLKRKKVKKNENTLHEFMNLKVHNNK